MKKGLLLFIVGTFCVSAISQTIVPTDDLGVPRTKHRAVLMDNGDVICFGGNDGYASSPVYYSSAEIFDTGTETWSNTGGMYTERDNFAGVLLSTGKVLAIGGKNSSTSGLRSCELYDPVSGTWSAADSLNYGRWGHKAITLQNGKVLVAGGDDNYGLSAEIYDPNTDTWTLTSDMVYIHGQYSSLVMLQDGKILCSGGWYASPNGTVAEVYDPNTDTWTAVGNMNEDRWLNHTSVLMDNGKVLIMGGTSSPSADIFDPATGNFTATNAPTAAKNHGVGFKLTNGQILAYSKGNVFPPSASLETFDPVNETWTYHTSTHYGMSAGDGVVLDNGRILLVAGNVTTGNGAMADCYFIDGVTAGIKNETIVSKTDFSIYPNPTKEYINIKLDDDYLNEEVQIIDCSGKIVLTIQTNSINNHQIDVSELEKGIYYCRAITETGQLNTKKFVIN